MIYRKKTPLVNAFQLTQYANIPKWAQNPQIAYCKPIGSYQGPKDRYKGPFDCAMIKTREGEMKACLGDWIIQDSLGGIYPCQHDVFEQTYELVWGGPLKDPTNEETKKIFEKITTDI